MKVGDKVMKSPTMWGDTEKGEKKIPRAGVVTYINRRHGFYEVEFATRGGPIRESYRITEGEHEKTKYEPKTHKHSPKRRKK